MSSRTEILADLFRDIRTLLAQQSAIAALPGGWRNKSQMVSAIAADLAAARAEVDAMSAAASGADTVLVLQADGTQYELPISALASAPALSYSGRISGDDLADGVYVTLDLYAPSERTITKLTMQTDAGTVLMQLVNDGAQVEGSVVTATNAKVTTNLNEGNTRILLVGKTLIMYIQTVTGATYLDFSIKVQ